MTPSIPLTKQDQLDFFKYYEKLKDKPANQKELNKLIKWWYINIKK